MDQAPRRRDNTNCCVPQCKSKGSDPVSFHKFPKEESKVTVTRCGSQEVVSRRNEWIRVLKIGKLVSNRMSVCSLHFLSTDYILPGVPRQRKHLKKTAVPSLNLPVFGGESIETLRRRKTFVKEKQRQYENLSKKRCGQWVSNMQGSDAELKAPAVLNKTYRLCSNLFKDSQFPSACKKKLLWNAVPIRFQVSDVQSRRTGSSTNVPYESGNVERRILPGFVTIIPHSSLEQHKQSLAQSEGMLCGKSLLVADFQSQEDNTDNIFNCSRINSPTLLKERLGVAQKKINEMKLCINQLKLENKKLQSERDDPLVKNVHNVKHDAVEGELRAIVLLNRIATYLSDSRM